MAQKGEIYGDFVIPEVNLEGEFACEMRFGDFRPKIIKFGVNLDPIFVGRD